MIKVKKSEIYKAARRNSKLNSEEWHFRLDFDTMEMEATHFPSECVIDQNVHGNICIIPFFRFGSIYREERARVLDEFTEFMDADQEEAEKYLEECDDWLDEFIKIPDKILGRKLVVD